MQTFEYLLKQETLEFCPSGHYFDSGMSFEDMREFYRRRCLREEANIKFIGARESGSSFFIDDLLVVDVYHPPKPSRIAQARELGVEGLKSHANLLPGENFHAGNGLNAAIRELRLLMQYHVDRRIPATCYIPYLKVIQGFNRV